MDKREGIYAVDARTIQTPKTGDTVYVDHWWCTDEIGNVYFTNWGMPLAYEKESGCRLVSSRFGLNDAIRIPMAYVTPSKYKEKGWERVDSQCC